MKPRQLPEPLIELLSWWADADGQVLTLRHDLITTRLGPIAEGLVRQGFLVPMEPAKSVICPGCEEACPMPVTSRVHPDGTVFLFVSCDKRDDIGRVSIEPEALKQWQLSLRSAALALAKMLGESRPIPLTRAFRLGWLDGPTGRIDVQLATVDNAPILLVSGNPVSLLSVLTWDGKQLGLNMAALRHYSAAPGQVKGETKLEHAQRVMDRKKQLMAAGKKNFLQLLAQEEGCSVSWIKDLLACASRASKTKTPANVFDGLGSKPSISEKTVHRQKNPKS